MPMLPQSPPMPLSPARPFLSEASFGEMIGSLDRYMLWIGRHYDLIESVGWRGLSLEERGPAGFAHIVV